ncbi:MAG: DNRLRE domain-containing protein, partial [Planctomycetota bacterium]
MNRFLLGAAILGCLGPSVAAQSVTIAPDRDNSLYESFGGELSNGAGSRIFAGQTVGGLNRRAILSFDIAGSVPAGAVITGVTFEATEVMNQFGGSALYSLHAVSQDWGEGVAVASGGQGGGQAPGTGDVTWDSAMFGSVSWTTSGGDFNPAASASATWALDGMTTQSISGTGLVADVQGWLDNAASNFGWILKSDELMGGAVSAFGSRESGAPPQLTVSYAMPSTITIAPSRDNSLYETLGGEVTNGGGTRIFVGRTVGAVNRRTILGFDVSGSVPAGSTITGVDIEI